MFRPSSRTLIAAVAAAVFTLSACGGGDTATEATPAPADAAEQADATPVDVAPGRVSPDVAEQLIQSQPELTIIDVRTPEEYAGGHIEGAELIDFYESDFAEQIANLPRDGEYLVYCRSGNRSGQAAQLMDDLGFAAVWDVEGGVGAWSNAGLELVNE